MAAERKEHAVKKSLYVWVISVLVAFAAGAANGVLLDVVAEPEKCDAHEVYVVDNDRCVSELDHGAHDGH